ncbi:DUF3515 family protein [Kocuria sediminis]|uniref:DUF3515 family protein n=1 Tax=Kocuria sediminis TaxID=1038857 RepID=A0A6N8GHX8_9MICC|nr:DUF3515 domain-containing protein [Kocuria sediminis]MUN61842.1 DUF3515 family protein [Kocuria sediminis]
MPLLPPHHPARALLAAGALAAVLTGCTPAVTVDPAENAADPGCAPAMLAMPETIGEHEQRETTSQATTAYGEPTAVVVRCGVTPPGPTTDPCSSVNDVDWLIRQGGADGEDGDTWTATTYGRDPAVEVVFDSTAVASSTLLVELGSAVEQIPADRRCLDLQDAAEGL